MDEFSSLIDVRYLIFSTIWILGLSLIVAALSIRHYEAQRQNIPLRQALQSPQYQLPLWIGLTMATIGFAGNADQLWEQLTWSGLVVLNMIQVYFAIREYKQDTTQ